MTENTFFDPQSYRHVRCLAVVSAATDILRGFLEVDIAVNSFWEDMEDVGHHFDERACQLWRDSLRVITQIIEPYTDLDPWTQSVDVSERDSLLAFKSFVTAQLAFYVDLLSRLTEAVGIPKASDDNAVPSVEDLATTVAELTGLVADARDILEQFDTLVEVDDEPPSLVVTGGSNPEPLNTL